MLAYFLNDSVLALTVLLGGGPVQDPSWFYLHVWNPLCGCGLLLFILRLTRQFVMLWY